MVRVERAKEKLRNRVRKYIFECWEIDGYIFSVDRYLDLHAIPDMLAIVACFVCIVCMDIGRYAGWWVGFLLLLLDWLIGCLGAYLVTYGWV